MNAPQTPEISKHQKFHIQAIIDETNNDRKATEVTTKDCPVCEKSHGSAWEITKFPWLTC